MKHTETKYLSIIWTGVRQRSHGTCLMSISQIRFGHWTFAGQVYFNRQCIIWYKPHICLLYSCAYMNKLLFHNHLPLCCTHYILINFISWNRYRKIKQKVGSLILWCDKIWTQFICSYCSHFNNKNKDSMIPSLDEKILQFRNSQWIFVDLNRLLKTLCIPWVIRHVLSTNSMLGWWYATI